MLLPLAQRTSTRSAHARGYSRDMVQIFEVELSAVPNLKIDNREIVEARFVSLNEALSLPLAPHLTQYFMMRADLAD